MQKASHTDTGMSTEEIRLVALLSSLKEEPTPEANFEERFLYDFHERIARETVCCPAHRRMWEHIQQILANFGLRRIAYGASTLGVGVMAIGYVAMPGEDAPIAEKHHLHDRFERTVSKLTPALSRDLRTCTTSTHVEQDDFEQPRSSASAVPYRAEIEDYTSSAPLYRDEWSVQPHRGAVNFLAPAEMSF